MRVSVRLIGGLVHTVGFTEQLIHLPAGTTAGSLVAGLGIDYRAVVTTRNGHGVAPEEPIGDGDRVLISPPFSGG